MIAKKSLMPMLAAAVVLTAAVFVHVCCTAAPGINELSSRLEPLRVCRANGNVERITFAQAMEAHHQREEEDESHADTETSATSKATAEADHHSDEHEDICTGVAVGYQAIRYATTIVFDGQVPQESDVEMSVAGPMPGVWDIMSLYAGRKLRPAPGNKGLSLKKFTFTAKRLSTGKTVRFHLRGGLIPDEFFRMKRRGVACGDEKLDAVKADAARKILSLEPEECFERI